LFLSEKTDLVYIGGKRQNEMKYERWIKFEINRKIIKNIKVKFSKPNLRASPNIASYNKMNPYRIKHV